MEDFGIVAFLCLIISITVTVIIIKTLRSILKEQKKTNYLLHRKMQEEGIKLDVKDYQFLNN